MATNPVNPVGATEIAELFGVPVNTVYTWRKRGLLPTPDWIVSNSPIWRLARILAWSRKSGLPRKRGVARAPYEELIA
ncbi:MAG TPA: helix-turn-helix domain-containing protein [Candidatus Dormibacteraeota bacterium]